jgi:hypothetical protein
MAITEAAPEHCTIPCNRCRATATKLVFVAGIDPAVIRADSPADPP